MKPIKTLVDTESSNFVFLNIYPADTGNNYEVVEEKGFAKIVIEEEGIPVFRKNPKCRKSQERNNEDG